MIVFFTYVKYTTIMLLQANKSKKDDKVKQYISLKITDAVHSQSDNSNKNLRELSGYNPATSRSSIESSKQYQELVSVLLGDTTDITRELITQIKSEVISGGLDRYDLKDKMKMLKSISDIQKAFAPVIKTKETRTGENGEKYTVEFATPIMGSNKQEEYKEIAELDTDKDFL